jgi:lipocalin
MWYEHERDKSLTFEKGDCTQAKYTRDKNNNIHVRNSERSPGSNKIDSVIEGTAYPKNDRYPIVLVSFFYIDRADY